MTRLATFAGISAYGRAGFGGIITVNGLGKGLVWGGFNGTAYSSNRSLISASGVVAADTTTVAVARAAPSACGFGTQQAIIVGGFPTSTTATANTNIVSALGVLASNVASSGDAVGSRVGVRYGVSGQGVIMFGRNNTGTATGNSNLISNVGVVGTTGTTLRTARSDAAGTSYGSTGTGIVAFGTDIALGPVYYTNYNLTNNTGGVAADVAISGATARYSANGASYGTDKGMFWSGANNYPGSTYLQLQNLVSNTGIIASQTTISSTTGRYSGGSMGINGTSNSVTGDKCIFTLGFNGTRPQTSDLFSNTGTWVSNTSTTASGRSAAAGATYG